MKRKLEFVFFAQQPWILNFIQVLALLIFDIDIIMLYNMIW